MNNRIFNIVALVTMLLPGLISLTGCAATAQAAKPEAAQSNNPFEPKHKVVIQVSSANPQVQTLALNNASNLQQMLGMDNVKVVIVAYGPGLSILTPKSIAPQRIQSLHAQGIEFDACHNTMLGIKRKTGHLPKLLAGVKVV
ncbi:MAG: hypothetical protein KGJ12_08295, partial [Gammaproteobacteria bacterium]|nr:hypothetical protein [Gammaproteobacteria bacterium]